MAAQASPFSIDEFLLAESEKDLLRFSTAGSVDDGKSTLIGRLLYDTQSVYEDQVRSIEGKGTAAPGQIDFALLTDGLRAEREQGITIDVAYRYFSTARRKFIIADTPGHEQYTRNMATGASTADAAIILIDASKGVLIQSRRHAYIASLLRVRHLLVAVNKMDLIGYDQDTFRAIEADFRAVLASISADTGTSAEVHFVPVSALQGDNVVHPSDAMPWYSGASLLELLEQLPAASNAHDAPFRLAVQRVLRPDRTFRGFAGQIASGTIHPGDAVVVLPSGRGAKVERIVTWDGDLAAAPAPLSVTLVLDRELDISRGDLIVAAGALAPVARRVRAALVWMDREPLALNRRYLLKHASQTTPVLFSSIDYRTSLADFRHEPAETLRMNDIGAATIDLLRPIALDLYRDNRGTGAFIVIDAESNATVAAGMAIAVFDEQSEAAARGRLTASEKQARWGHRGGVLSLSAPAETIDAVERSLFAIGAVPCRIDAGDSTFAHSPALLEAVAQAQARAGLLAIVATAQEGGAHTARVEGIEGLDVAELTLENHGTADAVAAVHQLLRRAGIFTARQKDGRE